MVIFGTSMPRNTYGPTVKERVKRLLEALLAFVDWEFEDSFDIKSKWEAEDSTNPKLIVETTLVTLEWLIAKDKYPGKLTKPKIREALNLLKDFLKILEDNRTQTKGVDTWHFTLTLWSKDREKNLKQFDKAWEDSRPEKSKALEANFKKSDAFDWRNICLAMLEAEKPLTTNQFMRDKDDRFELEEIHVPLALVERKKPNLIGGETQAEQGSRLYEPEYEEKQRFEHEQFLLDILTEGKGKHNGKRIAIIGEPGAGKTTLLRKIAFWVQENTEILPISISLADLPETSSQQQFLEQYLLDKWLPAALPYISLEMVEVTEALKTELKKLCNQGRVWLLLDGVDEMSVQGEEPLWAISNQLKGWMGQARVVLTCRLNVWEANRNVLADNFEIYRTLEFSYGDSTTPDRVGEFIAKWFKKKPNLGQQLRQALDEPGKERIKDLVKNPLRLALLCSTWNRWRDRGGLPDTKAKLYQGFVEKFYDWKGKEFPTNYTQREKLNRALGELAKLAIDKTESRFRLKHSLVCQVLGQPDEELFGLALKLGWLNKVGLAAESPDETVYAFWHPTFEEYFAALAVDRDYFLPRNHVDTPVSGKRYRIFEPQWKEVILLWLGREEIEQKQKQEKQKQEFIDALVKFEDRCGDFYKYRAYFIAAAGIAEFKDCSYTDEIVERVIEWKVGDLNAKNNNFYLRNPIQNAATAALLETHCENLVNTLNKWLNYSQIEKKFPDIAMLLVQVAPGHSDAIRILVNYLDYLQQEFQHSKIINFDHLPVIEHLRKFSAGHPLATAALAERSQNQQQTKPIPSESDISRLNLSTGNDKFENFIRLRQEIDIKKVEKIIGRLDDISTLIILLERKPILNTYSQDWEDINTLIEVLNKLDTSRNSVWYDLTGAINLFAVDRLAEIASIQSRVVYTLEEILNSNNNIHICQKITWVLGKAASKSIDATKVVVKLLTTTHEQIIAREALYFLKTILNSNLLAIVVIGLKDYIEDSEAYEIIWHCAQNMPYPDFYQAWHQDTIPNSATASLNIANLPQILAEAINERADLCSKVKLICLDSDKFGNPENPATKIYNEMRLQGCDKSEDSKPKTMAELQDYWDNLRIESEIPLFFICYDSTALSATPTGFSDSFLKALSKFDRAICVVCEQGNIPLPTFSPSQPDLVAAIVAWIRRSIL
ncbi:NACHT domain-containing protein [Microcoleus sp. Pol11C2]|uniref:NACHT C-terminal alpha/beta 1 domain-containing protein n=1 Tax=Microcoleus sp. Pol11C2 TaxID=3055389 RepID=UPI002FD37121